MESNFPEREYPLMRLQSRILTILLLALLPVVGGEDAKTYQKWGDETLAMIQKDYWLPRGKIYSEHATDESGKRGHPAFMWGVGVQLTAMAAASKLEPEKYLKETTDYAEAIQAYWNKHKDIEGFDVQPRQKESDRYYDDNAWLVLALAEVFEVTKDKKFLDRSEATFKFVVSCEDDKLGGGLYWRENILTSKHTCTNAPAIASALRLYQLTKNEKYLETAKRLYTWVNANLQDTDGLYWDNIRLDGKVNKRKYTYNSALMIRSNCLFHEITGEAKYLVEAKRVAEAAEKLWVHGNGAISDSGRFAHLLLESFLSIHQIDKNPHWVEVAEKTMGYVHSNILGKDGRYTSRWDRVPQRKSPNETEILNQSSPARAYFVLAEILQKK